MGSDKIRLKGNRLILRARPLGRVEKLDMEKWKWYVYIIECLDGLYYTGLTWKPDLRWTQHLSGVGSKFTSKHKPKSLVYLEEYENIDEARRRERQIKDWNQKKKQKLIKGEWGKWQ